jgi:hypothetical protein
MFKWIALGLGAYLLFGKKKLTEEEKVAAAAAAAKKDTEDAKKVYKDTDPTYLAWKAANEQTMKLEKQPMPPGATALLAKYPADNPPKIHSVVMHGGVATWNYHTKAGGKANLTYFLEAGTTSSIDISTGQAAPGWIILDPTAELGTKYEA